MSEEVEEIDGEAPEDIFMHSFDTSHKRGEIGVCSIEETLL